MSRDPPRFPTRHQPALQAPRDQGFLGKIWQTQESAWTTEFHSQDPLCTPELSERGFRAAFGFPVVADEEIFAVLLFFAWEQTVPDSTMRMLIKNLCEQLGRVVERSRWIEERARLAAIVDSSYDAIISKDLHGRIISWNQGAEQTYGYSAEEVLGQSGRLLLPEGMEEEESSVTDVITTGHRLKLFETKRRCKDGSIIDVALTVSPIRDSRGRIVGASSIERNMTFPKQTGTGTPPGQTRRRESQPGEKRIPGEHQPRTPHADERDLGHAESQPGRRTLRRHAGLSDDRV